MAIVFFRGTATAVAQVDTATPGTIEATDIFTLLVGGEAMAIYVAADTTVAGVTAGLTAAWNLQTHPYAAGITAVDSTTHVTLTADVAGVPFTITATAVDGGGADTQTLAMATTTASAGPNDLSTVLNYSGGALPGGGDEIWITDLDVNICWGLDAITGNDVSELHVTQTYTGLLGLDSRAFAISADGLTTSAEQKPEYRPHYMRGEWNRLDIGEDYGNATNAPGSQRIKIENDDLAGVQVIVIHNTAVASVDNDLPAVRLFTNASSGVTTTLNVLGGQAGGVGLAVDAPTDVPGAITTVKIGSVSSGFNLSCGPQQPLGSWEQDGGNNRLRTTTDPLGAVTVHRGTLEILGDFVLTALTQNGGTVTDNHIKTGGVAITTVNLNGGVLDASKTTEAKTYTTVNHEGGTLKGDTNLTVTTWNEPTVPYSMTATT